MTNDKDKHHFHLVTMAPRPESLEDHQTDSLVAVVVMMAGALLTIIVIALFALNMLALPIA